jgi:hypothetical protein
LEFFDGLLEEAHFIECDAKVDAGSVVVLVDFQGLLELR